MNRRDAIPALAALVAAAAVTAARPQSPVRSWRVGYLGPSAETAPSLLKAFQEGLAAAGYVDGRGGVVEYRWTNAGSRMNSESVLVASARDLVARKVDVIAASIDPAILAASKATRDVPIVMLNASDPIELGLVASLARPGGNITGLTRLSPELIGKNLQMLREVVPQARRIGLLVSGSGAMSTAIGRHAQQAAQAQGIALQVGELGAGPSLERVIAALRRSSEALVVADTGGGVFFTDRARLADLLLAHRLPAIFANTEIAEAGGLMSYSPSSVENYRRAGDFIDRILRGMKVGDIPVEQPTKFELVLNQRTAKAMNLVFPQSLLLRADRVIA